MTKTTIPVLCAGALFAVSVAVVGAQAKAASEGVFTADQAKRGENIYKEQCAACHDFTKGGPNKVGPNLWDVVGRNHGRRRTAWRQRRLFRHSPS